MAFRCQCGFPCHDVTTYPSVPQLRKRLDLGRFAQFATHMCEMHVDRPASEIHSGIVAVQHVYQRLLAQDPARVLGEGGEKLPLHPCHLDSLGATTNMPLRQVDEQISSPESHAP